MAADDSELLKKVVGMFRLRKGQFLNFPEGEVICGPNDRALVGFDTHFPITWLVEDFGFTEEEAAEFVRRVRSNSNG